MSGKKSRKWSAKQREGRRRNRIGDLRHARQCSLYGRLPAYMAPIIDDILLSPYALPSPEDIGKRLGLTQAQRVANRLWTIHPVDMTKAELAAQRKHRNKMRMRDLRRHLQSRVAYLEQFNKPKPWEIEGISRRTWFRRKQNKHLADANAYAKDMQTLGPRNIME